MGLEEQGRAAECCTEVGMAVLRKKNNPRNLSLRTEMLD